MQTHVQQNEFTITLQYTKHTRGVKAERFTNTLQYTKYNTWCKGREFTNTLQYTKHTRGVKAGSLQTHNKDNSLKDIHVM